MVIPRGITGTGTKRSDSQYIYAESRLPTKEPQWINVNNHTLNYFGGVPTLVICDNSKQAVIVNEDWTAPELNKDYAEWAEHNQMVILQYFSLDQFNPRKIYLAKAIGIKACIDCRIEWTLSPAECT